MLQGRVSFARQLFYSRVVPFVAIALLAACSTATSQTAILPPQASPAQTSKAAASPSVFKSTAALVLVDVLVSNGQNPIHGIPRQQFHLFEDGKEQPLVALEEHKAADPATAHKAIELPPNIYGNFPDTNSPGAVNVLLLDALNTPIADQAYVRRQMISYLKTIPPGTRMAIFTLASRLRMVQGFTSDSRPLLAALSGKTALPNQSALLADPNDTTSSDMSSDLAQMGATSDAMDSINQFQADLGAFQMDLRVRFTLDALQELARYLRGVPGRKNLIWFSGSFPLNLDPDATLQSPFEAMRNYAPDVSQTSGMLATSRVAVYPVDARGLLNDPQFNASVSGSGMTSSGAGANSSSMMGSGTSGGRRGHGTGAGSVAPPKFTQNSAKFFQQTTAEHATMQQIAEETGGQAFYNTNALQSAVNEAVETGASYYTLAYIPGDKADDSRFHKIKVTVPDAPSYKLTYRLGYVAETTRKQSANAPVTSLSAAMLRGAPPFSELLFKVRVLPADDPSLKGITLQSSPAGEISPKLKGPLRRYSIDYAADLHSVDMTETSDGLHHASAEFVAVAYNRDGTRLNFVDKAFSVNVSPEKLNQVLQKGLQIHQEIDLPSGEVYLRAAVHDLTSDRIGSVEIPLLVKPPDR